MGILALGGLLGFSGPKVKRPIIKGELVEAIKSFVKIYRTMR